jgi:hypothetical protein
MEMSIGEALARVSAMTQEEATAMVESIHPDDRALSEKYGQEEGGWDKFAARFPTIYVHATSDEHYGLMTTRLKRTIIGHCLVCRSHGVALHTQRLM